MALKIIEYKGKIIYHNDWRNLKNPKEFQPKIEEGMQNTEQLIRSGKTDILTLTDVSNSFIFGETVQLLKSAAKTAKPITKKSATVGLSIPKKILLNAINIFAGTDLRALDTVEQAKEWLVSD